MKKIYLYLNKIFKNDTIYTYFNHDTYQSKLIIRNRYVYLLGTIDVITFCSPNDKKEIEIVKLIENKYKLPVLKKNQNKSFFDFIFRKIK